MTEIEYKYRCTPEQLEDLKSRPALGPFSFGLPESFDVVDEYLDTEDRRLYRAGFALRLRNRSGRITAAMKGLGGSNPDGLHRRTEIEQEVPFSRNPDTWEEGELRQAVIRLVGRSALSPVVSIQQSRVVREIARQSRIIGELSLDRVTAGNGGVERVWEEVEVELSGSEAGEDAAKLNSLLREMGLRPEPSSKFHRALSLAGVSL